MAGDGIRFKNNGYSSPKPFISVRDKIILEWTTRSLPFIKHYESHQDVNLTFAIRTEHEIKFEIRRQINKIYGNNVRFVEFDRLTRGGLETAILSVGEFPQIPNDAELLFLDSDNHYDGRGFINFIQECRANVSGDFGSICYFEPLDNSAKWCFAFTDQRRVVKFSEKDETAIENGGKPMVGVFYFSSKNLFLNIANEIMDKDSAVKGEYFMSQSMNKLLQNGIPVFGHEVNNVIPLGTPDDISTMQ